MNIKHVLDKVDFFKLDDWGNPKPDEWTVPDWEIRQLRQCFHVGVARTIHKNIDRELVALHEYGPFILFAFISKKSKLMMFKMNLLERGSFSTVYNYRLYNVKDFKACIAELKRFEARKFERFYDDAKMAGYEFMQGIKDDGD